ncbi:MAG TPA: hypothetical protein VM733_09000 [Thermoanaerobaculia bacterium]|nr:hypothetical protein [Thermoanaerobaculia bacterium]
MSAFCLVTRYDPAMHATEFLDALVSDPGDPMDSLHRLKAMNDEQRDELRTEVLRRLAADTVPPNVAIAVLPVIGVEPAVPDLVRLLRSDDAPVEVRAAALILLRHTTFDLPAEILERDPRSMMNVLQESLVMQSAADIEAQRGTPFERLALADPEDDEVDLDDIIDELIESFCGSPEAAAGDPEKVRFWAGELVHTGFMNDFGSPALWGPGNIDELLTQILPAKLTLASADEAKDAVPAFRAFFRWTTRVTGITTGESIDSALEELEPDFPSMMMDAERFGMAKSFFARGVEAGFDMESEEGVFAFQEQWNREHALPETRPRKKADAAKKRKAKMAKLSRRRNRRKK